MEMPPHFAFVTDLTASPLSSGLALAAAVFLVSCSRPAPAGPVASANPTPAAAVPSRFEFPATDLMKAAPRKVFVHDMVSFRTPAISGVWDGWSREIPGKVSRNPDVIAPDGRREIGAMAYPVIGPYDMTDPAAVEYQCQLLKMSGVDGIVFDLLAFDSDKWRPRSMQLYVDQMQQYGLLGIVCFENKFYAAEYPDPAEARRASLRDMESWLRMFDPVAYKIAGRPVFFLFEYSLTRSQLAAWLEGKAPASRPILGTLSWRGPEWAGVMESRFGWTDNEPDFRTDVAPFRRYTTREVALGNQQIELQRAAELFRLGAIQVYFGGVSPGFDDRGCWGWGKGPTWVDRDDGRTYREKWDALLATNVPMVQVATWNDWMEGTTIEPALEYGTKYLEITRDKAALFKGETPAPGNLHVPIWIYKIRKSSADPAALRAAAEASEAIRRGEFARAESLVRPWAERLHLLDLVPWDAAAASAPVAPAAPR